MEVPIPHDMISCKKMGSASRSCEWLLRPQVDITGRYDTLPTQNTRLDYTPNRSRHFSGFKVWSDVHLRGGWEGWEGSIHAAVGDCV